MCLTLNATPRTPLRKGNIRYKLLRRSYLNKRLMSIYYHKYWEIGKRYRACNTAIHILRAGLLHDAGFHVFATYKDALKTKRRHGRTDSIIVAVEVDAHIASGYWQYCSHEDLCTVPSETWKYAKIVKVYK